MEQLEPITADVIHGFLEKQAARLLGKEKES